jgi:hypothetical protein
MEIERRLATSLGYGTQLFSNMINNGMVYVDKTSYIQNFLTNNSGIVFLCRPRRFGKTLLLTTIKDILEGKEYLFRNLDIGKRRTSSDWTISRVIQLDMSLVNSNPEEVNGSLVTRLQTIASSYGIDIGEKEAGPALTELLNKINSLPQLAPVGLEAENSNLLFDPRVAVLIDEYDAPLLDHLFDTDKSLAVQTVFRNFYKHLKASEPVLRFSFITGIRHFSETNVFSHMLNIRDISLNSDFSSICGFTEKELKTCFADHLKQVFKVMKEKGRLPANCTFKVFFQKILEWYDGYNWNHTERVLNPQSVLNFLDCKEFKNYWYEVKGPRLLDQDVLKRTGSFKIFNKNIDLIDPSVSVNLKHFSPVNALFQTGFLTMETKLPQEAGEMMEICYVVPNKEVKLTIIQEYLTEHFFPSITEGEKSLLFIAYNNFSKAFLKHDAKLAANYLSSIYGSFSHKFHHKRMEYFYHSQLKTALSFAGRIVLEDEHETSGGDVDLLMKAYGGKSVYVIEIKHRTSPEIFQAEDTDSLNKSLENVSVSLFAGTQTESSDSLNTELSDDMVLNDIPTSKNSKMRSPEIQAQYDKVLIQGINDAFDQIKGNKYPLEFFGDKTIRVCLVAVCVVGRSDVMIEFQEVKPFDLS